MPLQSVRLRKVAAALAAGALLLASGARIAGGADQVPAYVRQINLNVNGQPLGAQALFYNDRSYLPVRYLGERLGYGNGWDSESWTVSMTGSQGAAPDHLDAGRWAPASRTAVERLISRNMITASAPIDQVGGRPYAVFDWDNTSILGDTEAALFAYQIDQLAFKLTPDEFAQILVKALPAGAFADAYKNQAGQTVTLEALAADIAADYKELYGQPVNPSAEAFQDFKAKLLFLYDAIDGTHGAQVAYAWVLYFCANMTTAEVQALAEASIDANLGAGLAKVELTSPGARPGAAGVVQASYTTGMRTTPEIANLMHAFQVAGIDVYVVSASMEDVVRVFATNPKYGYGLALDHVLGIRLAKDGSDRYLPALKAGWPVTVFHGKVDAIQAEIARVGGRGPVFVAGDSDGDYNMLTEFPDGSDAS
jgi:phosphoserine phosphatase